MESNALFYFALSCLHTFLEGFLLDIASFVLLTFLMLCTFSEISIDNLHERCEEEEITLNQVGGSRQVASTRQFYWPASVGCSWQWYNVVMVNQPPVILPQLLPPVMR